ncbi:MAG: sugar transferase [Acidobacteriota bacterium]
MTSPTSPSAARSAGLQVSEHRLVLLAGDLAMGFTAILVSLWTWSITAGYPFDAGFVASRAWWMLVVPVWATALAPTREVQNALSLERTRRGMAGAAGVLLVVYLALYFYVSPDTLPRLMALYVLWESVLLTSAWRVAYVFAFTRPGTRRRVLIVGTGEGALTMARTIAHHAPHLSVVAFANTEVGDVGSATATSHVELDGIPVLGPADSIDAAVAREGIAEVILASDNASAAARLPALLRCQERGVDVVPMSTLYEQFLRRVPVGHIAPDWPFTLLAEAVRARDASRLAKRLFDIAGALVGLVALIVALPIVGLLTLIESGRPIFYRQMRSGAGGASFRVLKLRTMRANAETDGPRWAEPGDARVTAVGRLLRRSRLDELPQVINILCGDMSLVGPRPERPEFIADLERQIPLYRARLMMRPGLTGWAQVNLPYADSLDEARLKLEYDLYYIKHRTLGFDVWIILRTLATILRFGGR